MTKNHTEKLQTKFNYYLKKLSKNITKPESRFVHEIVLGWLKGQSVTMNQIAIHIQDSIRLKKILERFWKKSIESHIRSVSTKINRHDYAILDLSDIQKKYSRMMEGLARVYDKRCPGRNLSGIGVSLENRRISPPYQESVSP